MPDSNLLSIYLPLVGWTLAGWVLGRWLPKATPAYLGKFLFWIGVPIGVVAFLRHSELSFSLWIAPLVAWTAILLGVGVAGWIVRSRSEAWNWSDRTKGSFLLASMVGNTGYIGFPISLALVGQQHFAWALFYDLLGSTPGAYGLGVALASRFSKNSSHTFGQAWRAIGQNPVLWSFGLGILSRNQPLPAWAETSLHGFAQSVISLALVLVGMRLSQLSSFHSVKPALVGVAIKMVLVPLVLGTLLQAVGITGSIHRALLLQMAMPPAFATLVISEAYELDQELAVTSFVMGCVGLLVLLPMWLWLFG